jgi:hypothetical protein
MSELIERQAAIDALTERWNRTIDYHGIGEDIAEECKVCLNAVSTIDAVPKEKILLFLNIANEELSKAHADKNMNGIVTWSVSVTTLKGLLKEYDAADTDIVPVIRCKDCAFWDSEDGKKGYCNGFNLVYRQFESDYYCATAERKQE